MSLVSILVGNNIGIKLRMKYSTIESLSNRNKDSIVLHLPNFYLLFTCFYLLEIVQGAI